jgi:hypothetical protein
MDIILILFSSNFNVGNFAQTILYLIIGYGYIKLLASTKHKSKPLFIFLITTLAYKSYMYIIYTVYISNIFDTSIIGDEPYFYSISSDFVDNLSVLTILPDIISNPYRYYELPGAAFLLGVVGYYASLFWENTIIIQTSTIVLFSSLISVNIYIILNEKYYIKNVVGYILVYSLLGYNLFYSSLLLRDIPIAFFFSLAFLIVLRGEKLRDLIYLLVLNGIVWTFRIENGIFFVSFIFVYLYKIKGHGLNLKSMFMIYFLPLLIMVNIQWISENINFLNINYIEYIDYSKIKASSSSLGDQLNNLPIGIREISKTLYSQIIPFPFGANIEENKLGVFWIVGAIPSVFWFLVWFSIINIATKNIADLKHIDTIMLMLFFIAIIYLIGNSSHFHTRRLVAVYPIIYFVFVILFNRISSNMKLKLLGQGMFAYFSLNFVYYIIKF